MRRCEDEQRCRCADVSMKMIRSSADDSSLRRTLRRRSQEERQNRCQGATVWMYRCDIHVQMCGCSGPKCTRRARSPQRVVPDTTNSHSRLRFAPSTRTISAEGCAGHNQIDLRRGLRRTKPTCTLACISRPRHARSPQRVIAPDRDKSHSRLHFAPSTRTISAEGCSGPGQIALSPAFRALDTLDLRRGLLRTGTNRTLARISRIRHARSPQRVARGRDKSHSRLHFAHPTRTISAEGCVSWRSGTAPGLKRES